MALLCSVLSFQFEIVEFLHSVGCHGPHPVEEYLHLLQALPDFPLQFVHLLHCVPQLVHSLSGNREILTFRKDRSVY